MSEENSKYGTSNTVSRREFIKAGFGITVGSMVCPLVGRAEPLGNPRSARVVVVTDTNALEGTAIREDIVRIMVDEGVKTLTESATTGEAWMNLIPELSLQSTVGIKVNCASPYLPSHREIAFVVAESVADVPFAVGTFPLNGLVIWERTDVELQAAGYSINTSGTGIRCFGTTHGGIGFDPVAIHPNGSTQYVSRCYTDFSDFLINVSCLKNHGVSGVTLCLKNHYGTVHRALDMHGNACDPWIPALNATLRDTYGSRERLSICDALFGIRVGGPTGSPQFTHNSIVLSTDPVAVDAVCREILRENGCNTLDLAHHVDTASESPYDLGVNDLTRIELVEVINPSEPAFADKQPEVPSELQLEAPYPSPFRSRITIPVRCAEDVFITATVHDVAGREIVLLYNGSLCRGNHELVWNGTRNRQAVPSGVYIVKLSSQGRTISRRMIKAD